MINRFYILGLSLLILTGCHPSAPKAQDQKDDGFTFAFLTDIHLMPELSAVEGFQQAIDTINRINPDFVLTGGDQVKDVLDQTYGRSDSLYKLYQECQVVSTCRYTIRLATMMYTAGTGMRRALRNTPSMGKSCIRNEWGSDTTPLTTRAGISFCSTAWRETC